MAKTNDVIFWGLALEWWYKYMWLGGNKSYALESWRRLSREIMPDLGMRHPKKITAPMILRNLRRVEAERGPAAARKCMSHVSQIFRYGIACGHNYTNPARDLSWALAPYKSRPRPAITEPREIGFLMRDIEHVKSIKRRCMLKLAALAFPRPGELCQAEWAEFDLLEGVWRIPGKKMKMKRPHLIPLSKQAMDVLRELKTVTGNERWLFPSRWDKLKHEGGRVLTDALRRMGYTGDVMTGHGFRAMGASTLAEEGWPSEVIERQLAHVDKNKVRAAYQRSELVNERRKMLQTWADYLDLRCAGAILGR